MINWTPEGFLGHLFATLAPFAPPPPPGAQPPPLWGREDHVRELFGDRVSTLDMRRQQVIFDRYPDPLEFAEFWKRNYVTIAVYRREHGPIRSAHRHSTPRSPTSSVVGNRNGRYEAEYLLVTAQKADLVTVADAGSPGRRHSRSPGGLDRS